MILIQCFNLGSSATAPNVTQFITSSNITFTKSNLLTESSGSKYYEYRLFLEKSNGDSYVVIKME